MKEIDKIWRLWFLKINSKSSWKLLEIPTCIATSTVLTSLFVGSIFLTMPVNANSSKEVNSIKANRYSTDRDRSFSQPSTETILQPDRVNSSDREQIDFSDTGRPIDSTSSTVSTPKDRSNLDFSDTGRPGQRTAGGSRNNCLNPNFSLTALLPSSHLGKTVAERPTFWFYIPLVSRSNLSGEFVLQDEKRNDIYRIPFQLDRPAVKVAGLIPFSPPETTAPLQSDRPYRWYFKLYCTSNKSSSPIFVQGWVQRVALEAQVKLQLANTTRPDLVYAEHGIWYDALNYLAQMRLNNPNSTKLQDDWRRLLTAKGVNLKLP
ncbi:MAG: DUF928 domain-containing protein [Xenococcaceae cyanobacterium]